jgi:glycosyltransferase involved in cell wall biosynthesis
LYYVGLLAKAASERGDRVVVALSRDDLTSSQVSEHLGSVLDVVDIVGIDELRLSSVAGLSRRYAASITVVPDGDHFAFQLAKTGRWNGAGELSVLIMRETGQPSKMPGLQTMKTFLRSMLIRRASRIPRVRVCVLKSALWAGKSEFRTARDPVTLSVSILEVEGLRQDWGLTKDRYWFAVLGAISARKNVNLVAEALRMSEPTRVGLLIAGTREVAAAENMRPSLERLAAEGGSVVVIDRLLSNDELDSAVVAADCIVLAYSNEGPSGLFGKAAAAGTRIVAAGAKSLREETAKTADLSHWASLDVAGMGKAFRAAMELPRPSPVLAPSAQSFSDALL